MTENELLRKRFNKAARTGDFLFRHYKNLEETAMQAEIAAKTCWLCGGPINTRPLTAGTTAFVYLKPDAEARLLAEIAAGETPTVSASDFLAICGRCLWQLSRTRQKAKEGLKNGKIGQVNRFIEGVRTSLEAGEYKTMIERFGIAKNAVLHGREYEN